MSDRAETVKVWDPLVRVLHWALVVAFFVAYFTEDDLQVVHVWAGYVVGAVVIVRILWGVVGSRHARFTDFIYRPSRVFGYLKNLARLSGRRYIGHSPAGGAMTVALLLSLAVTVGVGLFLDAADERIGPLAPLMAGSAVVVTQPVDGGGAATTAEAPAVRYGDEDDEYGEHESEDHEGGEYDGGGGGFLKEVHELFANLTLFLVILHIGGVALASYAHRENLPRAMVTGRKRPEG